MDSKSSASGVYPKTINHIAVSVPNLEEAMKWYTEILGFTVINPPVEIVADDSLIGIAVKDIHGPKLKKMRMAWLSSANQVGLEIFEYVEPRAERRTDNFEYWKSGFIHICVTDPDKGIRIAFCENPFGNIIEIYDHSYEQTIISLP
jgi:catechol-2,3-dioxygenase